MHHWNLGNTTVRNPDRIKEGLRVFRKVFDGRLFTEREHLEFHKALLDARLIESKKSSTRSNEITGRKWAACFNQLGLTVAWKSKDAVRITDAGTALLSDEVLEEEVFLRQFLKYHLPSPIERGKKYSGFDVNPLYVILNLLNELAESGTPGLTKEEISLFVITCLRNEDVDSHKNMIDSYRRAIGSIKGRAAKRGYYHGQKRELVARMFKEELDSKIRVAEGLFRADLSDPGVLQSPSTQKILDEITSGGKGSRTKTSVDFRRKVIEAIKRSNLNDVRNLLIDFFMSTKGRTLSDYADTTVRYTAKTGLLSISGDRLVIKEDRVPTVKAILDDYPFVESSEYLDCYYSATLPHLPSDHVDFLHANISTLQETAISLREDLGMALEMRIEVANIADPNRLKKIQKDLETRNKGLREQRFYRQQATKEMIQDILEYYDKILRRELLGGDAYRPAYMEWTTWRLFLAINNLVNDVSKTRNFEIDEELNPIHHARSGEPDMVFEYPDFVVVCEVTLRTTGNQWAEEEPVPRHVAKIAEKSSKRVFGVFVAPSIDPNTLIEFYKKISIVNEKKVPVDIVPLTLDQLKSLLVKFDKKRFTTYDLRVLLEESVAFQAKARDPLEWGKLVSDRIDSWALI